MRSDIDKAELFAGFGFGGEPSLYDAALTAVGLTNPSKRRILLSKSAEVERVLREGFMPVCGRGDCQATATAMGDARQIVPAATTEACAICGGGPNVRAIEQMVEACRSIGWSRICIVGGSPNTRQEIERLVDSRLELRLVEGDRSRTATAAKADIAWADLVVIWGATQLNHKVSISYRGPNVVGVGKRSIAEVAEAVAIAARRRV